MPSTSTLDAIITAPSTRYWSWVRSASSVIEPSPGHAKIVSATNEPETSDPSVKPNSVMSGLSAFGSACRATTLASSRPLARAVVT